MPGNRSRDNKGSTDRRGSRDNKRGSRNSTDRRRNNPDIVRARPPPAIKRLPQQQPQLAQKQSPLKPAANKNNKSFEDDAQPQIVDMVQQILSKGLKNIEKEYETLALYHPQPRHHKAFKANMERNRYNDVDLCDDTRVVLKNYPPTDYIHASWVDCGAVKTICAQGPLDNTVPDFWQMVMQEEVALIVMLCETVEHKREKCWEYWPTGSEPLVAGLHKVCKTGENKHYLAGGYVLIESTLEVCLPGMSPRTVTHSQLKDWPDRGVLTDTRALLKLRRYLSNNSMGKPVVVHCSAGVGRTGTLVLLEMVLYELEHDKRLDVPACFRRLRNQRFHSVQNVSQYIFLYHELLMYAEAKHSYVGDAKKNMDLRKTFQEATETSKSN